MMTTCMWPEWDGGNGNKGTDSDEGRPDSIPSDSSTERDLFSSLHGSPNFLGRMLDCDAEATSPVDRSSISYGSLGRNPVRPTLPVSPDHGVDTGNCQQACTGPYFRPIRGAGARRAADNEPPAVQSLSAMSNKWDALSENEQNLIQRLAQLKFEGSFANSAVGVGAFRPSVLPDDPYDPSSLMSNVWLSSTSDARLDSQRALERSAQEPKNMWPQAESATALPQRWTASPQQWNRAGGDTNKGLDSSNVRCDMGWAAPAWESAKVSSWPPDLANSAGGPANFSENVITTGDNLWPNGFASGPTTLSNNSVFNIWNDDTDKANGIRKDKNLLSDWILRHERPGPGSQGDSSIGGNVWDGSFDQNTFNGYQRNSKDAMPQLPAFGNCGRQGSLSQTANVETTTSSGIQQLSAGYFGSQANGVPPAKSVAENVPDPILMAKLSALAARSSSSPTGSYSSAPAPLQNPPAAVPQLYPTGSEVRRSDAFQNADPYRHTTDVPRGSQHDSGSTGAPHMSTPGSTQCQQQAMMNHLAAAALGFAPPAVVLAAYNNMIANAGGRSAAAPNGASVAGYPAQPSANQLLASAANPFLIATMAAAMASNGVPPGCLPAIPGVMPPFGAPQIPPHVKLGKRSIYATDFHTKLEDCMEEYKLLEKERKKTEAELARNNLGKKINSQNSLPIPRPPANPSRLDRLLVDYYREHARMITLVGKMEQLINDKLPAGIHNAMSTLVSDLKAVHTLRTAERNSRIDEKGMTQMIELIGGLTRSVRSARSALFSGLTLTIETQRAQREAEPSGEASTA